MHTKAEITISIVSHQQIPLVTALLQDLTKYCASTVKIILTLNLNETIPEGFASYPFPLHIIRNSQPKGFGQNHNAAFKLADTPYFCVLNPDIRLTMNPFPQLITDLQVENTGVAVPAVFDEHGHRQDNARHFPAIGNLLRRVLTKQHTFQYKTDTALIYPDWVAGMFMLFKREIYAEAGGFDEKFYLYCEDVDLCARLVQRGYRVLLDNRISVMHSAQRDSHRKMKYLAWHVKSMLRYFYNCCSGYYNKRSA